MAKKSWPYPVLDPAGEDYPGCAFQASVKLKQTRTSFVGSVRMDLGSETLTAAIGRGDAKFALQLHCPRTSHRQIINSAESSFGFDLPESLLRGDFTVQPYVVSTRKWELESEEFATFFKDLKFPIARGYVLAVAPEIIFDAEKRLDDLRSVKAIFCVIRNNDSNQKLVEFDFERDRVAVVLPGCDYDLYFTLRNRAPYNSLFLCSLILPALNQALALLRDPAAEESGQRWKRVLRRCLTDINEENFERERSFEIAQKLLDMPIGRALLAVNASESDK